MLSPLQGELPGFKHLEALTVTNYTSHSVLKSLDLKTTIFKTTWVSSKRLQQLYGLNTERVCQDLGLSNV